MKISIQVTFLFNSFLLSLSFPLSTTHLPFQLDKSRLFFVQFDTFRNDKKSSGKKTDVTKYFCYNSIFSTELFFRSKVHDFLNSSFVPADNWILGLKHNLVTYKNDENVTYFLFIFNLSGH